MRKKRKRKLNKKVLGGALITSVLLISIILGHRKFQELAMSALAYDQQNTHPALTDEAIDFYNLNFPKNPLSQKDKALLIRGAVEEDTPPRWLNHFYDPVYNKGWIGYTTSKEWGISSTTQQTFTDSAYSYGGFANLFSDNLSPTDFSYERALHDYASGNRKRAMLAMGHVMHLLEDSNVPEHTRGDTHLPWHGTESPYEKTMAKWNPGNTEIAQELFTNLAKPVLLNNLADYFDELAQYSNGYFFSQDTINNEHYNKPELTRLEKFLVNGKERLFIIGTDKNKKVFKLALAGTEIRRNIIEKKEATLVSPEIGTLILDDYWARLAPDFVVHGAGALKLFLEQAELVKQKYVKIQENSEPYSSWFGNFLSFLGFPKGEGQQPVTFDPNLIEAIISQPKVLGVLTDATNDDTHDVNGVADTINDVGNDVANSPTLLLTSLPSPTQEVEPPGEVQPQETEIPTLLPTSTPSQVFGGGGGGVNTPTPIPSPTPLESATASGSLPLTGQAPTPTPSPSGTPEVEPLQEVQPLRHIIINEVAWMGTGGTAILSSDEWLELYNTTSLPIDVGGWRLRSITDNSPNITIASKTIEPYGFFLLERTSDDTISDISADQVYTGNLNDTGEALELRDNDGVLQDLVSVSDDGKWYAGEKATRSTMERIDPLKPGNDPTNWVTNNGLITNGLNAAGEPINGTPKARNSIYTSQKPSTVNDLAVDLLSSLFDKVKLVWSAPEDIDTPTDRLKYEIRYDEHAIDTDNDWGNAQLVAKADLPSIVSGFGRLQSASFSIFDFNLLGKKPNPNDSFTFSLDRSMASDCRDIKTTGGTGDVPHPDADSIVIYNTDTGLEVDQFGGEAGQQLCNFDYQEGHYSAVIEHVEGMLSCIGSDGGRVGYEYCKNSAAFEGEIPFVINKHLFNYGQDYYFAIKTYDGEQWSYISNIAKYQVKPAVSGTPNGFVGPANPRIVWEFNVPYANGLGQPAVAPDGTVFFGAPDNRESYDYQLYAVNPDGTEKWHWENHLAMPSTPAVSADGTVYFGQYDPGSYVTALNPDGSERWQFGVGDRVNNVSVDARGNVYFTSENRIITKVKPNGKAKWQIWNPFTFNFLPIVDVSTGQSNQDKDVYFAADAAGLPGFYRLSGEDGSTVWQSRADDNFIYYTFDPTYDPSGDKFYAPTTNYGQILTINREDGVITKDIVDMGGGSTTKVAVLSDSLVFGMDFGFNRPASGSMVYAVNKADKSVIWTFAVDSPVNKQIAVDADENLYFSTRGSKLYSIDKKGQERWVIDLEVAETYIYPILWENAIFMGIGGGEGAKLLKISD